MLFLSSFFFCSCPIIYRIRNRCNEYFNMFISQVVETAHRIKEERGESVAESRHSSITREGSSRKLSIDQNIGRTNDQNSCVLRRSSSKDASIRSLGSSRFSQQRDDAIDISSSRDIKQEVVECESEHTVQATQLPIASSRYAFTNMKEEIQHDMGKTTSKFLFQIAVFIS